MKKGVNILQNTKNKVLVGNIKHSEKLTLILLEKIDTSEEKIAIDCHIYIKGYRESYTSSVWKACSGERNQGR